MFTKGEPVLAKIGPAGLAKEGIIKGVLTGGSGYSVYFPEDETTRKISSGYIYSRVAREWDLYPSSKRDSYIPNWLDSREGERKFRKVLSDVGLSKEESEDFLKEIKTPFTKSDKRAYKDQWSRESEGYRKLVRMGFHKKAATKIAREVDPDKEALREKRFLD